MPTTNMVLTLPTTSVTTGPTYANQVNTAITTIDAHDHTTGKGVAVPSTGIGINANLTFAGYSATNLKSTTFTQQSSLATANSVWTKTDGNLWFTNGSGVSVQITSSGTLNTSALITAVYSQQALAGDLTMTGSETATHYLVDTSAARAITLPAANLVSAGRYFIFSDATGSAASNNITITRAGADTIEGGASVTLDRAGTSARLISDGTSKWIAIIEHDATTAQKGRIKLAGDLGGTAAAPTVVGLTGASNKIAIASGCATIEFNAATSDPTVRPADTAAGAGTSMRIIGQNATTSNYDGGPVTISGGNASGSGIPGGVTISTSVANQLRVGAFTSSRRYVALVEMPGSSDLPTGNGVVYIGNATATPTSNPTGGGVLYVQSGALMYRGTGGTITTVGPA